MEEPKHSPETEAKKYINADNGVNDEKAALDGARAILMERIAEDAELLEKVRQYLTKTAELKSWSSQAKKAAVRNLTTTLNTKKY